MRGSAAFRVAVAPGGALAGPWVRDPLWTRARAVPSLDLRFADNKSLVDATTGQNLVTFTRASSATYVGSDGLLKTATTNEPRFDHNPTTGESLGLLVEEARTNLWLQSQFASSWTPTRATLQTNDIVAPDATMTGAKLVEDTTPTLTHLITQSISVTSGTPYTVSVFVKATASPRFLQFIFPSSSFTNTRRPVFDLVNGTALAAPDTTASIQNFGNGWYRCIASISATVTGSAALQLQLAETYTNAASNYTGNGVSGVYIWGAQVEASTFPTSYIPTVAATVTRAADVASITGSNFGITRTNLLIYSEDFNNATYTLTSATVSQNTVVAPDDFLTADTVNASGTAVVSQSYTKAASSITYTASLFVKGSVTDFNLTIDDGTSINRGRARFNLATGTSGSILSEGTGFSDTSGTIAPFPNGWYRITVTTTTNATTTARHRFFWSGSGTSVDVWGAQLEANSAATPYIPSTQTFTSRASGASYFDVAGVLQWKPQNLLLRSEEFDNGAWTKGIGLSVAPNTTISPIETLTADTVTGDQNIDIAQTITAIVGITYTNSVYVKAGTATSLMFRDDTGASRHIIFNPSTGVITAQSGTFASTPTSQPLDNGWYRYSMTYVADTTSLRSLIRFFSAGLAQTCIVWGAQLEQVAGSFATPGEYTPTLGTATGGARNSAYLPDSSGVFRSAGLLLLEEARTNLWQWSNSATSGETWNNVGTHLTLTAGQTSPAGNLTAIRAADVDNATSGTFLQRTLVAPALTANTFVSYSIFIKPINIPNTIGVAIFANVTTDGVTGLFTVSGSAITGSSINYNGTGASGSASYVACPNGWYRVTVSGIPSTVTMADCRVRINLGSYTRSTGTARFDWYGGQFENNAFASSYFPNAGTLGGVTRAADVSSSTATSVFESSWYNQTEGTVFANTSVPVVAPATSLQTQYAIHDGSADNRITVYKRANADTSARLDIAAATVSSAFINAGTFGLNNLTASAVQINNFAISLNGLTAVADTAGNVPSVNQMNLGSYVGATGFLNGTIRRLCFWSTRLGSEVLPRITQP